ncbi:MAG: T9SS type A sorting domain-containing protein, partial [Bacteroidota bacterium]|nr:T9SS type A sorting domain-containing protein [Bacteroidota bacterium]
HVIVIGASINQNGDDAIELFVNGTVVETYGDINVDGTGEVWDYEDSWAYKDNGSWTYGGANCSDGSTTTQTSSCPDPLCPLPPPSDLVITTEICNTSGGDVVRLTGPWWSWDPLGGPVANDNGDGTYTFTFSPAPTTDMEYLLVLNGVQEDMVAAGTSSADWSCTPVTDYFSYANRQWTVGSGDTVNNVYGQCSPVCSSVIGLELTGIIDFDIPSNGGKAFHLTAVADESDISSYGIGIANNGGGTDGQEITFPAIAVTTGDDILLVRDSAAMASYFGACMSEFEHVIVIGSSINHNGDDATELFQNGLVIETYGDINVDGTGEVWDYEDAWAYKDNGSWTYGGANCSDGSSNTQTSSCPYPLCPPLLSDLIITTEVCGSTAGDTVRLTGPWWNWDPLGGPVATDNGDGTYTFTFSPAPTTDMEYLLVLNGVQEDMVTAGTNSGDWSCTPVTDYFSYANRQWTVGSGDTVNNVYGQCGPCSAAPVSDLTITTEVCGNFGGSTVRLTGPWWNWDPNGGPVAADNGDGTYTFTFSPAPTSDMEYLLVLDGVQEDMVAAGTSSGDWSCTPVTDYFSYANRQWTIGSGDTVNNVYGQCSPCGPVVSGTLMIQGVMDFDLPTPNPPVSGAQGKALHFKVDGAIADLSTFGVGVANNGGGTDGQEYTFPAIAASSGDEILLARDTGSISSYFGTCFDQFDIVLVATGSISQNGDDAIELYNNGAVIDIFGDVNVDGSGEPWEYLDSWAYRSSSSADTAFTVSDWQYGGVNCTDGDSLIANSACIYPICQPNILNITVEVCSGMADTVRLTGPFWSWDPNGGPIGTDNGNGTWTFEFNPAPSANMEYLFVVDGVQEDLISAMVNGGTCAPVTDYFSYANRLWEVGDPDVTDAVYGQCDPCTGGPAMVDVTFQVDMTNAIGTVNFTTPEVQGEWNWAGGGVSMTDSNNDNTWECVKSLAVGDTIEYIFAADNFAVQETLDSSFSCVIATVDGGVLYVNRFVVVPSSDVTLNPVCWESCDPCVVGINSGEMPFARIFPNPASNNLTVQSENGLDKLIIRDMLGRIVIELDNVSPNNFTIDLSSFSNDIYLVELYKGDNKSTKKLIVMQ